MPNVTCLSSNLASQPAPSWNQIQLRVMANSSTKPASTQSITALPNLEKTTLNLLGLKSCASQKPTSLWANHQPTTPRPMFRATLRKKETTTKKKLDYQPNTKIKGLITFTPQDLRSKLITANLDPKPTKGPWTKLPLTIRLTCWRIITTSWVKTNQGLGIGLALVSVRIANQPDQHNQLLGTPLEQTMNSVRTTRTRPAITKWDSNSRMREMLVTPLFNKKLMKLNRRCRLTQLL